MRIAAFNVENLFDRAKALNEDTPAAQAALDAVAELTKLFEKPDYSDADKARMLALFAQLGILDDDEGEFVWLRRIRGSLIRRPRSGSPEITAGGRADWVGWIEHKTEHVNETAVLNTGRVIRDVNADILAVIEAEDRVALKKFSSYVLEKVGDEVAAGAGPYAHVMVIDGNDDRGIDVGLMTKAEYRIDLMRSHVHDSVGGGIIFSRDCPEYCVHTPGGTRLWVLPNHLKSKFGGDNPEAQKKRKAQAKRVAQIYKALREAGEDNVVVLGDLNDTPDSPQLKALVKQTDLRDVSEHESFDTGEFAGKGTYGLGNDSDKIDYLLLSPALFGKVTASGLFRKGAWPGRRPKRWSVYPTLEEEIHVGSDHHVIWADIDL